MKGFGTSEEGVELVGAVAEGFDAGLRLACLGMLMSVPVAANYANDISIAT